MLQSLHVKNIALIDEVELELLDGLNILTGETGAGKSIIIDSISFALGGRVDKSLLREKEEAGFVELIFTDLTESVCDKLRELEIEPEDDAVILSRRITGGRSIAKINGESVPASRLKAAAACLIDIHGQHEHQSLLHANRHLEYLDDYAKAELVDVKHRLAAAYKSFRACKQELEEQCTDKEEQARELAFLEYEVQEIEAARLVPGEDEALETEYRRISNSKKILEALALTEQAAGEEGAGEMIARALRELSAVADYDGELCALADELSQIDGLLADFHRGLTSYMDEAQFDGERFARVEERLDVVNRLKAKYGDSIDRVLEALAEKQARIEQLQNFDAYEKKLREQYEKAKREAEKLCGRISDIRKEAGARLRERMLQALQDLNFLDVRFDLEFERTKEMSANGFDAMEFLISTNPGEPLRKLKDIASGGELSRIMLALKSVLAENDEIETLIFDEIDTGISGRTAQMVSQKLHMIAGNHQVICITHLPQIAAMADAHFYIEKNVVGHATVTTVTLLDDKKSVAELGRMLGGVAVTDTVLKSAREMKKLAKQAK